jgi:large subunit ribosomal protein L23
MIRNPINTEKAIRMMESENKLVFAVDKKETKATIKQQIEAQLNVKVASVHTITSLQGKKKAIVKFAPENPAIEIATKMGMM